MAIILLGELREVAVNVLGQFPQKLACRLRKIVDQLCDVVAGSEASPVHVC
ncbi:hypothetical protein V7793_05240 [Streptomyces sp. KLMMK]|uniref:hypothetical protein n=1 Tax=Streptomyces sp. KLMMK TaxID=3109353 RepID=UPI002FFF03EF